MGALSGDEGLRSDRLHGGIAGSAIGRGTTRGPRVDGRTWAWRGSGQASAETVKRDGADGTASGGHRSEEHTSELQSLMRISYAVFCLKKKKTRSTHHITSI